MRYPTPVGAVLQDLDILEKDSRFPFFWWAAGALFKYPDAARHLFVKCGSAAEAFFLRPFVERAGVEYTPTAAVCGKIEVLPQFQVGKYRLDFAVFGPASCLAVEIDGMTFHQKTEEQVEGDYLRARRITASGYSVIRFTAREAFTDGAECWRQVEAVIDLAESRVSKRPA